MLDSEQMAAHAQRIRASGILGRSGQLQRLFDFLVTCSTAGKVPKEMDIAVDAFGRGADFDSTQDAAVRVYIHKLRRRLDEFYAGPGREDSQRIAIGPGDYRLILQAQEPQPAPLPPPPANTASGRSKWLLAALLASLLLNALLLVWRHGEQTPRDTSLERVRASSVWSPLITGDLPITLVLGDYYIFGETDDVMNVKRMIREFTVNSRHDLEDYLQNHPDEASNYTDLGLSYLPTGTATAMREVLPVLAAANKRLRVVLASEMTPDLLTRTHVVYLGYLSGLGMLQNVVFAGSGFTIGDTYDELIDRKNDQRYISQGGNPWRGDAKYKDYGYFSTFAGPSGNRIIVIAGTRDSAVANTAEAVVRPNSLSQLARQSAGTRDYEALYEVYGVDRTNLDSKLLKAAPLNTNAIWRD